MERFQLVALALLLAAVFWQTQVALSQTTGVSGIDTGTLVHIGPQKNGTESTSPLNSIVLGGLMNIHSGENCDVLSPHAVERSLAMVYAIEAVNNDSSLLPGISLCYEMFDTCSDRSSALQRSLAFLPGRLDSNLPFNMEESGVVGAAFSSSSIAAASITQLFEIPQISYASTAEELSDKSRYPYFFRTLPSDGLQTQAMADIAKHFGWTYIAIIYTDDDYGRSGNRLLRREIERSPSPTPVNNNNNNNNNMTNNGTTAENNVRSCVAFSMRVSNIATGRDYDEVVNQLLKDPNNKATAVIIFGQQYTAEGVLSAWERRVQRGAVNNSITWIASDGWSTALSAAHFETAQGTIGVFPTTRISPGFDAWFRNLSRNNTLNSPWFNEYWEHVFNCTLNETAAIRNPRRNRLICSELLQTVGQQMNYAQDSKAAFTIDAVLAFGHALSSMQAALCGQHATGLCEAMMEEGTKRVDGEILKQFLQNVSFPAESMDSLEFDETQSVVDGYTIVNLQPIADTRIFAFERVGEWNAGKLSINDSAIYWNTPLGKVPTSMCSSPCQLGEYRFDIEDSGCCWECRRCRPNQIGDGVMCSSCPRGERSDATRSVCVGLPVVFFSWANPIAITLLVLSGLAGIIVSVGLVVYLVYWRTKVIKSTSRELTIVMILGIILCYLMVIPNVGIPNQIICGLQRVGYSFCYTIFFGALLIKINRIHRIFNRTKSFLKPPPFISWHSQLVFVGLIILGNLAIAIIWLVVEPPVVVSLIRGSEIELRCGYNRFAGPTIEIAYIICILVGCVYFALRTRKVPCDYNETRFINITVFCVLVIWIAYLPIYYSTTELSPDIYIASNIVSGLIIASCVFLFLVAPKFYLLLVKKQTEVQTDLALAKHSITLKPNSTDLNLAENEHTGTKDTGIDSNGSKTQIDLGTEKEDSGVQTNFTLEDWNRVLIPDQSSLCSEIVEKIDSFPNNNNNNNNNTTNNNNSSSSSTVQLEARSASILCTTDAREDL